MSKISITYSNSTTPDEIIYELMKIEEEAYSPEYRGKYEPIRERFHKFKDMFVLAYDNNKIIGYLCFFPISMELHDEILCEEGFHDDEIDPGDVMEISERNNIYLLSIALYKIYQGKGIGKAMVDAFFHKLKEEKNKGRYITDIIASVVTDQGERIARKNGFSLISDYMKTSHYKLYRKEGEEI